MADNVEYTAGANATPPATTKAATDELADGSHAGIAKLAISADGDRTLIPATAADGLLVEVSNAGIPVTGGLTDAELRATPVPVSGTVAVTEPVSVDDNGGSLTVDAPVGTPVNVQVGDGSLTATVRNTGAADSLNVAVVDGAGNQITTFGGSGGTAEQDGAAFVPDTTSGTPAMGAFESAPTTLSDGEVGIVGLTDDRQMKVLEENSADIEALLTTIDGDTGTLAGTVVGAEVQVDVVAALPAGTNNIGDVDIASLPNEGQQTMANSISVAIASNQSAVPVSGPLTDAELRATPVDVTGTVATGGLTDAELRATPVPVSGTVTANAGTNLNTSALALESGGNLAAAAASLAVMDDWDETDRAKVNPIVGQAGVQGASGTVSANTQRVVLATDVALPAGTNNIGDVDVLTLPAIPAGNNNIGDVDIASLPNEGQQTMANSISVAVASDQATFPVTAAGTAAHASPTSGNPVYVAGRASNAIPTDVGADGDVAALWMNRNGAQMVSMAPHLGIMGSPWTLTSETAQYTTTQTSTVLVAGGASERIVVTKVQIQAGGTTAGTLQLYFGTGAYSRGTSLAIFDGEFAPSATLKPGVVMDGPFISATNGDDLMVTDSAAINPLTITVWYYLVS